MRGRGFTAALIAAVAAGVLLGVAPTLLWEFGDYQLRWDSLDEFVGFHLLSLFALIPVVGVIWWKGPRGLPGCLLLGFLSLVGLALGFALGYSVMDSFPMR